MAAVTAVTAGVVGSSYLASRAQKKQAQAQAEGIRDAQQISSESADQARRDALQFFDPAFSAVFDAAQQARNELQLGRANTYDILNRTNRATQDILTQGSRNYQNILLGRTQAAPQKVEPTAPTARPAPATMDAPAPVAPQNAFRAQPQPQPTADVFRQSYSPEIRETARGGVLREEMREGPELLRNLPAQAATALPAPGPTVQGRLDEVSSQRLDPLQFGNIPIEQMQMPGQAAIPGVGLAAAEEALLTGGAQARSDLSGQTEQGISALRAATDTARGDINTFYNQATGEFEPYISTGTQALDREAALSGALGAEAQQAAYDSFIESPGQSWLRDQSERALIRNKAAVGDVGGGNVFRELQAQAQGLALQDLDRQMGNLRSLATRGQQASGSRAGYLARQGDALSGLEVNFGNQQLGARERLGQGLSNVAQGVSRGITDMRYGTGQALANNEQRLTDVLTQIQQQTGMNLANADENTLNNAINLLTNTGGTQAQLATQLATLLGNIGIGAGSQQSNLAQSLGQANASGVTNPWGNALGQLTGTFVGANPNLLRV